ncbi:ester cyclase [Acidisoma cladoniae]|uniref:ester cyclase n=1 Tax=Acidisoma cladoniae TaxID=3040935 RepID=UPI00254FF17B|nr:ester cyclase [Acidisoma sp. PAMC 29798]
MTDIQTTNVADSNKRVVIDHFEGSINRREPDAISRTIAIDRYVDHDGPEGSSGSVEDGMRRMEAMFARFPDFHVDLLSVVAEGDMVVVRGVWSGTDAETSIRVAFRAFVQYRLEDGRIVERWATSTPPDPVQTRDLVW